MFSWRHLISCLAPSTSKNHQHWAPTSSQKWQLNLRDISTIWMTPKKSNCVCQSAFSAWGKWGQKWCLNDLMDLPKQPIFLNPPPLPFRQPFLSIIYQNRKVMLALGKHNQDPYLQSKPGVFWNKHSEVVFFKPGHIHGFPWPGKSASFCWRENKTFIFWLLPFIYSLVLY